MSTLARGTNADIICTAASIPRKTMRQLFNMPSLNNSSILLRVPPFQRRYCWGQTQIDRYLIDIAALCTTPKSRQQIHDQKDTPLSGLSVLSSAGNAHAFGRVVVTRRAEDQDLSVVDGQQRCTTTIVFLTALRDFVTTNLTQLDKPKAQHFIDDVNQVLFPNGSDQDCIVRPTYFDRPTFNAFVNNKTGGKVVPNTDHYDHVHRVRSLFDYALYSGQLFRNIKGRVAHGTPTKEILILNCAISLFQACLDKMCVLLFLTVEDASEAQAMYGRLAVREQSLSGMSNRAPGVSMEVVDLCRNLILCVLCTSGKESTQVEVFEQYWAPLEELALAKATKMEGDLDVADVFGAMLKDFITETKIKQQEAARKQMLPPSTSSETQHHTDPGEYDTYFSMYTSLRQIIEHCRDQEEIKHFLACLLEFGVERWKDDADELGRRKNMNANETNNDSTSTVCWCKANGTKCNDCIVSEMGMSAVPKGGIRK